MNIRLSALDMGTLYLDVYNRRMEEVQTKTTDHPWECLDTSDTDLQEIFSQYGKKRGLFSDGTKKHQFADAIVFERLKRTATPDAPVYIYSKDNDFIVAARDTPIIEHARSWNDLLQLLGTDQGIDEVKGLIEVYGTTIVRTVSETIDKRFKNRLPPSKINALNYISSAESKSGVRFRYEHYIVVSGTVLVTYRFPAPLPVPFGTAWEVSWEEGETLYTENELERTEYCFEVSLLANLYDFREIGHDQTNRILDGEMTLEIESLGHFIGYEIMHVECPVS